MIIVSQDKEIIINFDNSSYVCKDDDAAVLYARTSDGSEIEIGEYATEERAKEVLEEIVRKYVEYVELTSLGEGIKQVYKLPKVYRMPKE